MRRAIPPKPLTGFWRIRSSSSRSTAATFRLSTTGAATRYSSTALTTSPTASPPEAPSNLPSSHALTRISPPAPLAPTSKATASAISPVSAMLRQRKPISDGSTLRPSTATQSPQATASPSISGTPGTSDRTTMSHCPRTSPISSISIFPMTPQYPRTIFCSIPSTTGESVSCSPQFR